MARAQQTSPMATTPLPRQYFERDALIVARELLGCVLCVADRQGEPPLRLWVVETEAYHQRERGAHCFGGRRTRRTAPMFAAGGITYVYLVYGLHWALNVVVEAEEVGAAVLIRAARPLPDTPAAGLERIATRRGVAESHTPKAVWRDPGRWLDGPGKLCQGLAIDGSHNAQPLAPASGVWFEAGRLGSPPPRIIAGPRIGIGYAGPDAALPWRFRAATVAP